ncbi:MAG TPA: hypothetical protein PK760_13765 [Flavobacteriales bacterium]|nr:hypothetical protein [Flavobacteriales bacterium]
MAAPGNGAKLPHGGSGPDALTAVTDPQVMGYPLNFSVENTVWCTSA